MKTMLGRQETQMLAYLQLRKSRTVRTGDLTGPLRLTRDQERELFRRMARGSLIARVRPGLYLVPPQLPLGGSWSPDEILALNTLMEDRQGTYQICGPNAFNRYGLDEQVPTRVYAYNNRISGQRTIGAVALTLIKVADNRLGGTEKIRTAEGLTGIYSSRTRTLVDAVYDWARFNSLPRGYEWIRKELAAGNVTAKALITMTLRYGDKGTIRRTGALLEREGTAAALLVKLERALRPSKGLIPWIPTLPKRGKINRRWGVVFNDKDWAAGGSFS
jgi:predicted transcriptional regulator of viral defense system